jgi:hypothetical protein
MSAGGAISVVGGRINPNAGRELTPNPPTRIWLDSGSADTDTDTIRQMSQLSRVLGPNVSQVVWRVRPGGQLQATKLALRTIDIRIAGFNTETTELDKHLRTLVPVAVLRTLALLGGDDAQLLITAGGNPEQLRSETAFAALCAAPPIPASSGKPNRHRFNRAGDITK